MVSKNITLPESVLKIIDGIERRKGSNAAQGCRERIIAHMVASDEIFYCVECKDYLPIAKLGLVANDGDLCKEHMPEN